MVYYFWEFPTPSSHHQGWTGQARRKEKFAFGVPPSGTKAKKSNRMVGQKGLANGVRNRRLFNVVPRPGFEPG